KVSTLHEANVQAISPIRFATFLKPYQPFPLPTSPPPLSRSSSKTLAHSSSLRLPSRGFRKRCTSLELEAPYIIPLVAAVSTGVWTRFFRCLSI
ncbi:hypothetical protein Pfo_018913, partial [Paulownia fortunei]